MVNDAVVRRTSGKVLFLSEVFSTDTQRRRGIPTPNVAAWNRTSMIAGLLEMRGYRVSVLSSGVTFRSRTGFALHGESTEAIGTSSLRTLHAVGPRYVSRAIGVVLLAGAAFVHLLRERPDATIAYNYSFLYVLIGVWSLILGIRFVVDIEDITELVPDRSPVGLENLKRRTQILAMHWTLKIASAVIVPARSFAARLGLTDRFAVIDYSMTKVAERPRFTDERVNVLFCGPYAQAHGYTLLLGTLERLRDRGALDRFRIHFTGNVPDPTVLARATGDRFDACVVLHGFLSAIEYRSLLSEIDVGLSLQLSSGPFGRTNTPSKSFEFLAAGLLLVCTEVGDQGGWRDRALVLDTEAPDTLATLLESIAEDRPGHEAFRSVGHRAAAREWHAPDKATQLETLLVTT